MKRLIRFTIISLTLISLNKKAEALILTEQELDQTSSYCPFVYEPVFCKMTYQDQTWTWQETNKCFAHLNRPNTLTKDGIKTRTLSYNCVSVIIHDDSNL